MANSLLKLTIESSEYDAKLKKAAEGIRHLADVAHQSDGDLTGLEKSTLDYIKAVGEMETKSRTAAGSVRELESTYKELKVIYDQLNEVEKADEGGKALAASLEQIKTRAQEARAQLDTASKSLNDNGQSAEQSGGILESLASKFTLNIDALKLFDMGLSAAKVALDVAKDAFMSSETNVDDWGRTVRSAEGIYQSFVQSLNTGDFTGFLSNIGRVTQAAQEAYNALDELGTRMTIINPERAKLQARQQELRADIRRNGADSEVGKAALAELKKIEPLLSKSFKTESQMNYTAFEKLVRERLAEGGINLNQKSFQQFMKTFSSDAAFQNLRKNARGSVTTEMTGNAYNPNAAMTRRTVDTRNTEQKLLDLFTDDWRQANSGYLTASFSAQGAAASNMLGNSRYMKTTGGGGSGSGTKNEPPALEGSIDAQTQKVQELQKAWRAAADDNSRQKIKAQLDEAQRTLDTMTGKKLPDPVIPGSLKAYQEQLKESQADVVKMREEIQRMKEAGEDPADIMVKQDELDDAIENLDIIHKKIDELNGKTAKASIDLNVNTGDFNGQTYIQKLQEQLLSDAQNANMSTLGDFLNRKLREGMEGADLEGLSALLRSKIFPQDADDLDEDIDTYIQTLKDKLGDKIKNSEWEAIKLAIETGDFTGMSEENTKAKEDSKDFEDFTKGINTLTGGLSSVSSGLKNIGVEVPKDVDKVIGVISGVSQVISGVQTVISLFGAGAMAANTTAVALNTVAIGGLISALYANTATNLIPGLANGGIVPAFAQGGTIPKFADGRLIGLAAAGMMIPGNSMSGDRLRLPVDGGRGVIGVNSGELILNKSSQYTLAASLLNAEALIGSIKDYSASLGNAQQTILADQLEGNPMGGLQLDAVIGAEDIQLVINNRGRRTGRGEYVQSRNRRQ